MKSTGNLLPALAARHGGADEWRHDAWHAAWTGYLAQRLPGLRSIGDAPWRGRAGRRKAIDTDVTTGMTDPELYCYRLLQTSHD